MKTIPYFIAAALFIVACSKDESSNNSDASSVLSKLKTAELVTASNEFGFGLLKKTDSLTEDKNVFISPFSALQALSMTYNGANGQTKTEMANALGFSGYTDTEINEYNQSLSNALLEADSKVELEIANSIWYRTGFNVLSNFININQNYFDAEVNEADFTDAQTVTDINNWCSEKTHEKIPEVIRTIPENAVMYLINAIYFKGTWQYAFDSTKTTETIFYKEDGTTVLHNQMALETELNYYSSDNFQLVELPYGDGQFNFVVVLPKNDLTVSDLIQSFNKESWGNAIENTAKTKLVVMMPKFKFEFNGMFNTPLESMGMPTAFSPDDADFTNINQNGDLYISTVLQKTYIDLNENGTEAAAVTIVGVGTTSEGPGTDEATYFIADRPFLYAITEKSTGAILFIGKMMDPAIEAAEME
jgi:serine protease inhibitor